MAQAAEAAMLLEKAQSSFDQCLAKEEDLVELVQAAEKALTIYRELRDGAGIISALTAQIHCLITQAADEVEYNPSQALRVATEELEAFTAAGDRQGKIAMMLSLAEINMDRRGPARRDEALAMAKMAKALCTELDDRPLEARCAQVLAKVLIKICDKTRSPLRAREAIRASTEALVIHREQRNRTEEAYDLYMLFIAKMYGGTSIRDGLKYGKEAASIYKELGLKWWHAVVLRQIAYWFRSKGNGRDGLPYAEGAMAIFTDIGCGRGWEEATLSTVIGAYIDSEDKGVALEIAREGVEKTRASGDKLKEAQATTVLASAFSIVEDNGEALSTAQVALTLYREVGDRRMEMIQLQDIATFNEGLGQPMDAVTAAKDALEVAVSMQDVPYQARLHSMISRFYMAANNPDEALRNANEAIAEYSSYNDKDGIASCLMNKAGMLAMKGDVNVALTVLEEARSITIEMHLKSREAQTYHFASEMESQRENFDEALRCASVARGIYKKLGSKSDEAVMLNLVAQASLSLADKVASSCRQLPHGSKAARDSQRQIRRLNTQCIKAAKESHAIARKVKDTKQILVVNALSILSQAQGLAGKFQDALKSASEALKISKSVGEKTAECHSLICMAQIHGWFQKMDEARSYWNQALHLARSIGEDYLEQFIQEHIQQSQPFSTVIGEFSDTESGKPPAAPQVQAQSRAPAGGDLGPYTGPTIETVLPMINELALSLLASEEIAQDKPLMDAGLDSLSMVQFRNTVQQGFPGVPMPASLVFDRPSIRAVSENIVEEMKAAHAAGKLISASS